MKLLLMLFGLFSILHLAIAVFLPSFISESEFPYKELIYKYFSFFPFSSFANFDGYQYLSIAKIGYKDLQQSYFPLFPFLIALVSFIIPHFLLAGVIVSWVSFFFGLVYFKKLVDLLGKDKDRTFWALLFLLSFPTAFFFQMIYTEGIFLFLMCAALYYVFRKQYKWAVLFAVLASLTKVQGVFLLIPFLVSVLGITRASFRRKNFTLKSMRTFILQKKKLLLIALSPVYGLLLYMTYLSVQYKNPFYFYTAQAAFGAERAVGKIILLPQVLYRYIKIFLNSQINFAYWISVLEFTICIFFVAVIGYEIYRLIRHERAKNMQMISLQVFSLSVLLLPTLTGTLTSLPRYALISIGFFIALSRIKSKVLKISIVVVFLLFQILLLMYFLKGYFVS